MIDDLSNKNLYSFLLLLLLHTKKKHTHIDATHLQ